MAAKYRSIPDSADPLRKLAANRKLAAANHVYKQES